MKDGKKGFKTYDDVELKLQLKNGTTTTNNTYRL